MSDASGTSGAYTQRGGRSAPDVVEPPDGLGLEAEVQARVVEPSADAFRRLVAVMAKLRTDCPWDREQTHESLAKHLLEETYETLEAIDEGDLDGLREELGDLVIQVVFHSQIAFEEGDFTIADVLTDLQSKLVRRHPHVFGDLEVSGADEVKANWERIKRSEKQSNVLDGIPRALPALARAAQVHRRAVEVGFRWRGIVGFLAKLTEELDELRTELDRPTRDVQRIEDELGDVLFMAASLAQQLGVDPETALRRMLDRFSARFRAMEDQASDEGEQLESLSPDDWQRYWEQAKKLQDGP